MKYSNPNTKYGTAEGFSLVEVMIAVFILTVGLLAAAQVLTMATILETHARLKSTATLVAKNELDRLADLYRRNPESDELTIGEHQSNELMEIWNPITKNVLNRYKITWFVSGIPDARPGIGLNGCIISVRAIPMLTESAEGQNTFINKAIIHSAIIVSEP